VLKVSILTSQDEMDISELNLDGSHAIAKKGGACIASGWRKK
jgi:hypothetical protein